MTPISSAHFNEMEICFPANDESPLSLAPFDISDIFNVVTDSQYGGCLRNIFESGKKLLGSAAKDFHPIEPLTTIASAKMTKEETEPDMICF